MPMNTIEAVLDSARFLRIHRSHIVNVRRIAQLWSIAHGQYLIELRSGQRLYWGAPTATGSAARSRTRSDSIGDRLRQYAGSECLRRAVGAPGFPSTHGRANG